MSRAWWKNREREAAALIGGRRYPANVGGAVDCESEGYVCQVKELRVLSLKDLERLAIEAARVGGERTIPKAGLVLVKRSAGRGYKTPWLVVMTEEVFRFLNGKIPVVDTNANGDTHE